MKELTDPNSVTVTSLAAQIQYGSMKILLLSCLFVMLEMCWKSALHGHKNKPFIFLFVWFLYKISTFTKILELHLVYQQRITYCYSNILLHRKLIHYVVRCAAGNGLYMYKIVWELRKNLLEDHIAFPFGLSFSTLNSAAIYQSIIKSSMRLLVSSTMDSPDLPHCGFWTKHYFQNMFLQLENGISMWNFTIKLH